jgi:two-component system NarL family sensor kinase
VVAVLVGTAAAAAVCGALVLSLIADPPYVLHLFRSPEPVIGLAFSVVGTVLVAGTRVARPMGWLLLAIGICAATYVSSTSISAFTLGFADGRLLEVPPDVRIDGPIATAVWLTTWTWFPALFLTAVVLPQVVPYGRPLSRRWNLLLAASYAFLGVGLTVTALQPGETTPFAGVVNPYGGPALAGLLDIAQTIGGPAMIALQLLALVALVLRFLRADGVERRQIGLFGLGVVVVLIVIPIGPWWLIATATTLIPISIAVAALRYRLYELDLLVNRALVAAVLLGGAALVYVALVGWVGSLVGYQLDSPRLRRPSSSPWPFIPRG